MTHQLQVSLNPRPFLLDSIFSFVTFQFLSQCDEVVFMDAGRVLDQGRHTELMSRNGHYASLLHIFQQEKDNKQIDNEDIITNINGA